MEEEKLNLFSIVFLTLLLAFIFTFSYFAAKFFLSGIDKDHYPNTDLVVYRTSVGNKYHLQSCKTLSGNCIRILLPVAIDRGYTPCRECDPPGLITPDDYWKMKQNQPLLKSALITLLASCVIAILLVMCMIALMFFPFMLFSLTNFLEVAPEWYFTVLGYGIWFISLYHCSTCFIIW